MVQLVDSDIQTREVLEWKGLHLLHHPMSSCSKKVRIFSNLKGIDWESHVVDILHGDNYEAWFLGINPRGMVPVLIDDGAVHIESNDILLHLEEKFPEPAMIPAGGQTEMAQLLKHEDDLHLDLRNLSFRFFFGGKAPVKPPEVLEQYRNTGSGTVQGKQDPEKVTQIQFYETLAKEGITDTAAQVSAQKFCDAFGELENRLGANPYLLGDALSVLDIAWFIYADRLVHAGYPFMTMHPQLGQWFKRLYQREEFAGEVQMPKELQEGIAATRKQQQEAGQTLSQVAGF